jgi:hypothetical protein
VRNPVVFEGSVYVLGDDRLRREESVAATHSRHYCRSGYRCAVGAIVNWLCETREVP